MRKDNEVQCADCGVRVVSKEVLKAKDQLDVLRVSLEIEEIKQRIEELKLGRSIDRAKREERMDVALSEFALETLPELKTIVQALAVVLTAHIKDMGPEPKKPTFKEV